MKRCRSGTPIFNTSFERIRQFKSAGTALILVSHDRLAIQSICDRAILLDDGAVAREENLNRCSITTTPHHPKLNASISRRGDRTRTISGDGGAVVTGVRLNAEGGDDADIFETGASVVLRLLVRVERDLDELICGYVIRNRFGRDMYGVNTFHIGQPTGPVMAGSHLVFEFAFPMNLGAGEYSIATALTKERRTSRALRVARFSEGIHCC